MTPFELQLVQEDMEPQRATLAVRATEHSPPAAGCPKGGIGNVVAWRLGIERQTGNARTGIREGGVRGQMWTAGEAPALLVAALQHPSGLSPMMQYLGRRYVQYANYVYSSLLAKLVRHHAAFLSRRSIGFTDSRSPAAPRMAVRLRSSGFPDFESTR
jgi:hypothetical protein